LKLVCEPFGCDPLGIGLDDVLGIACVDTRPGINDPLETELRRRTSCAAECIIAATGDEEISSARLVEDVGLGELLIFGGSLAASGEELPLVAAFGRTWMVVMTPSMASSRFCSLFSVALGVEVFRFARAWAISSSN
jgi:hypothetical protein